MARRAGARGGARVCRAASRRDACEISEAQIVSATSWIVSISVVVGDVMIVVMTMIVGVVVIIRVFFRMVMIVRVLMRMPVVVE